MREITVVRAMPSLAISLLRRLQMNAETRAVSTTVIGDCGSSGNSRKPGLYPAFFVPQPSDNLQILIYKQYGVTPSDANTYGLLSEYLLQLNPEVKSVQQVFGKHVPRTLNFISHSATDLVCQNPDLIKRQISSYMQPGRQFSQSAAFA